jgi:chromosome transmission fidelity protein 18
MYNLTYQQERNEEGQYEYKMDPDIENVVCFPGVKRAVTLSYATKQLVAHEIDREKMRRSEVKDVPITSSQEEKEEKSEDKSAENTPKGKKKTDSHLQKLKAKPVNLAPAVAIDFFGRAVKVDPNQQTKKEENSLVKSDIWFKFKEGYTNAVRRTIKMKDMK